MKPEEYLDVLLNLPGMYNPIPSPDGKYVAWTWFRIFPSAEVYVAPTDGSGKLVKLTDSPEDSFVVSWTHDSRSLIIEEDCGGDERFQLFMVDIDNPEHRTPLTEPSPPYFIRGGSLHPNCVWLVYGANYDFKTNKEIEPTWLYRHNLITGERLILAHPQKPNYYRPEINKQGTLILYSRNDLHPAGQQIWIVDIEGIKDQEILNFGSEVKVSASWHPNGKEVVFLVEAEDYRKVGLYNLEKGEYRWLIDNPDRNIEEVFIPFNSNLMVVVEVKEAKTRSSLFNLETFEEIILPSIPGNLVPLAPIDAEYWVGTYYSSKQPTDAVLFSIKDINPKSFQSLSRVWERTPLKPHLLSQAKDFRWYSTDGLRIQGWLYQAENPKGTVISIHGGPTDHSEDRLSILIQFLVSRGFNVLDPNYRGSTGFGLAFQEAIKKNGWGGMEQLDIKTGIEALIKTGIAKNGKVGVVGTSYGGYSSWWAITQYPPELVSASAPICGMTDLVVDYETTRPDLRPYSEEMMGGSPTQVPERYYERSPINFIKNIKGKLLIIQGKRDPNVTPENVRVVKKKLDKFNIPYEFLSFEDEGHGIKRPKNQKTLFLKLAEFFEGM